MTTSNAPARLLAILVAFVFIGGALKIVLGAALFQPDQWTDYQVLTVLAIAGTIGAGHLSKDAWRLRHYGACAGFVVAFLAGTALVVYQSVGRQVETSASVTLSAEDTNTRITEKREDLSKAKARKDFADGKVQTETANKHCGKVCRDWKQNSADIAIVIARLEADIAALGPQKPVNAKAESFAELMAALGFNRGKAAALAILAEPYFWTLLFEYGSIVSLGFAFRHAPRTAAPANENTFSELKAAALREIEPSPLVAMFSGEQPDPPHPRGGRKSKKSSPANVLRFPAKHPVVQALETAGGSASSNRELASLMSVSEGEASKRWQEIEHLLDVRKVGKQLRISLRRSA